ncbi:MAG TPA: class III extradiol ring-cleavage dioxygenase [Thermoplasmata archaeon]|nr:class III extradiol ring-cleavage dioxygenase [Thermoplasmata archaeon]
MPLVGALYVPNAPFLIAPRAFEGRGATTAATLQSLNIAGRFHPDAVVVATPHWVSTDRFLVQSSARPPQVRDFSGFPPAVSTVEYRPPGDPGLAAQLVDAGTRAGVPVSRSEEWGLDHGAWAPLLNLLPAARTPTVPLSITPFPPAAHLRWGEVIGQVLAQTPQRSLFIGTGSILHAFSRYQPSSDARWAEGAAWEQEIAVLARDRRLDELLAFDRRKWAQLEPEGQLAPLFMLLGSLDPTLRGRIVATEQLHGAFGMTVLEYSRDT